MRSVDHRTIVNELNELIEDAGIRPGQWHNVVSTFRHHFPEAKISFQAIDRLSKRPIPFIYSGWSEGRIRDYLAHFGMINPWRVAWLNMGFLTAEWSEHYLSNTDLRKSEYYADMLRPEGECDSGTGLKLIDESDQFATFTANYASEKGEGTHQRISAVFRDIALPMRKAINTNRLVGRAAMSELMEGQLLQALCDAALVLDRRGRVIAANVMAQEMLAKGSLIRTDVEGRAYLYDISKNEAFLSSVFSICSDAPGRHIARDFAVERRGEQYRITLLPVSPGQIGRDSDRILPMFMPGRAALIIVRPEAKPDREEILQRKYGFTKAQVSIALGLTEGGALVEVADRLGMKYETARSHLKAIFSKTGVNKQSELVGFLYRLGSDG